MPVDKNIVVPLVREGYDVNSSSSKAANSVCLRRVPMLSEPLLCVGEEKCHVRGRVWGFIFVTKKTCLGISSIPWLQHKQWLSPAIAWTHFSSSVVFIVSPIAPQWAHQTNVVAHWVAPSPSFPSSSSSSSSSPSCWSRRQTLTDWATNWPPGLRVLSIARIEQLSVSCSALAQPSNPIRSRQQLFFFPPPSPPPPVHLSPWYHSEAGPQRAGNYAAEVGPSLFTSCASMNVLIFHSTGVRKIRPTPSDKMTTECCPFSSPHHPPPPLLCFTCSASWSTAAGSGSLTAVGASAERRPLPPPPPPPRQLSAGLRAPRWRGSPLPFGPTCFWCCCVTHSGRNSPALPPFSVHRGWFVTLESVISMFSMELPAI